MKRVFAIMLTFSLMMVFCGCEPGEEEKPVIYLYPEQEAEVTVRLDYAGAFTCTYPEYDDGWKVTAMPDGTLFDAKGNEYSYLFWEGESNTEYDMSRGFCVKGEDTAGFLKEKLSYMGLTAREYNEFIVYWLPRMQGNRYNLITFQQENYAESAKLEISPEPDNILRVFMVYKPLTSMVAIEPQELPISDRVGFTVVEWGGCEIK
ncbi:MAG: hypothetical protein IJD03_00905 [Clostridia bacterium]|nr:hypothetical protein [Clostridia bacterium]